MANMLLPILGWRPSIPRVFERLLETPSCSRRREEAGPKRPRSLRLTPAATAATLLMGNLALAAEQPKVDFARDIQPIFIKRCFECHGPDKQKNDLRLDRKADALRGGKSGKPLFLAGKSSESELIARVTSQDPDEVMPAKGERLRPEQIDALRAWIDQGGFWPDEKKHWAFTKPARPGLPEVKSKRWQRNEIEHLILSRLAQEKLS